MPPHILRIFSDDLLAAVFPDAAACQDNLGGQDINLPDHPLIYETMKDVLTEALDVDGLIELLQNILNGQITCLSVDTPTPSPFVHQILNANPYAFLDDAPLEERRARAVEMRRILPDSVLQAGHLDPTAIQTVKSQAWPDVRNADECHDALQTLIAFPKEIDDFHQLPQHFLLQLQETKRAHKIVCKEKSFWVATEKLQEFFVIYPPAQKDSLFLSDLPTHLDHFSVLLDMIRGWLLHLGPTTQAELSEWLSLDPAEVAQALLKLESTGMILRGHFLRQNSEIIEWCERRLLARIHRLTLGALRQEIAPVTTVEFMQWLLSWQHITMGTQLRGETGLIEVIKQLQGFEIPASVWEKQIFSKRLKDFDSALLDHLCLTGVISWGRISAHPALTTEDARVVPSKIAPITFFIREDNDWLNLVKEKLGEEKINLSTTAKKILDYLQKKGAAFFSDITRGIGGLPTEIENGLWELVAAGLVTADSFDNLRALINPKRRQGQGRRQFGRPRYSAGRWSLIVRNNVEDPSLRLEKIALLLLRRYGVVFRDLIAREAIAPFWRDLLMVLRRLEDRGEVRGGRFVANFRGEQFALPYVVDSLRAFRKKEKADEVVIISAVDPLNLAGIIFPGNRIPAHSGKKLEIKNGTPYPVEKK